MTEAIRCLIVDDEPLARELLRHHLTGMNDLKLVGEAKNGFEALKQIRELSPDLIFLDIQMPKLNGFEMLELLDQPPEVVFCTAYDAYAVRAFEKHAVDYLLKPFDRERFEEAVRRATIRIRGDRPAMADGYDAVSATVRSEQQGLQRVVAKTGTRITVIPVESITYFEAQEDYVMIHSALGSHLKEKTMKYYEEHLPPGMFVRVHRSYMVNIHCIKGLSRYGKESYIASLTNGDTIRVSASGYKILRDQLK